METKTQRPILDAIQRMHAEDDKRLGVDPYNTGRHRALLLKDATTAPAQRKEAEDILACFETELKL